MNTRIFALATTAVVVTLMTGCSAPAEPAGTSSSGDSAAQSSAAGDKKADAKPAASKAPAKKPSKPAGPKKLADQGWIVESNALRNDGLGDFGGTSRITNTNSSQSASLTLTVFKKGKQVAALIGAANVVAGGKTVTVQWTSQDKFVAGPYTYDFQVNAAF